MSAPAYGGASTVGLAVGAVVAGRYRVEAPLGAGGFGEVYRATELALGREVALKVLLPNAIADQDAAARFKREAELVLRLDHPNVVRLYDFGWEGTRAWLALELLRGSSLADLVAAGPLPAARVVRIGVQMLKALMAAHRLGIVHRDVKPANVHVSTFAGEPDFVKLLDFGIARATHGADGRTAVGVTREGVVLGTPAYMSPEQMLGGPLSPATDVYAAGLVLAEALMGRPVFQGSAMQVIAAQSSPAPVPLPPEVLSSSLGRVIERATDKAVERRFASAEAMLAQIAAASDATAAVPMQALPTAAPYLGSFDTSAYVPGTSSPQLALAGIAHPPAMMAMPAPGYAPPMAPPSRPSSAVWWILGGVVFLGLVVVGVAVGALAFLSRDTGPSAGGPVAPGAPAQPSPGAPTAGATGGKAAAPGAGATAPKPAPTAGRTIDKGEADAALASAAAKASSCKGPPTGTGSAQVAFAPGGGVVAVFLKAPFVSTSAGACIEGAFKAARVTPYDSEAQKAATGDHRVFLNRSFTISGGATPAPPPTPPPAPPTPPPPVQPTQPAPQP